ncbi:MAG: hypothetical protein ABWY55_10340 [Microbacterium sp.]
MARRKRSFSAWIRIIHRWISMAFVVAAALLILPVLPQGPAFLAFSGVAIVLLVLLILTGLWMAVTHYTVKFRTGARRPVVTG